MIKLATLVLEDGTTIEGQAFGAETDAVFELVFNTSMTGYQEILTDPSYKGQGVLFTVSHIGNVGINLFMEDAFEIDVDALADGLGRVVVGAVMQHIEEAGVHSGDAACVLPPYKVSAYHQGIMQEYTEQLGLALGVRGLMNVQFAFRGMKWCACWR